MPNGHYKMGEIYSPRRKNGDFIVSKKCPLLSWFRRICSLIFIILRRETENIASTEIKQILVVRIVAPYFMGIFRYLPTRNAKKTSTYCTP